MRDPGLNEAIHAVGSVSELARKIGISQPSVSNWPRVPAERVVSVESASGVHRSILRPDLYGEDIATGEVDEIDMARAEEYGLLATLLSRAPDKKLLGNLSKLRGDVTPMGVVHAAVSQAAASVPVDRVEREFFDLFIGIGRGEILPYASYYLTGFLHDRPLARLRDDLGQMGIARAEGVTEPEDHAAILCEIMAGLVNRRLPAPAGSECVLFEKHLAPWIGRLFTDLERIPDKPFYNAVGSLGRIFIEIETEAFDLPS